MFDVLVIGGGMIRTGGGAAKSSDGIGRMAAPLVQHGTWRHDLDASLFRACFC